MFAIAITLLVLEISVSESDFENVWQGIVDQWPSYLAYVTSFATIGGLWMGHHGIVRRLAYADGAVMRLNLLLLMAVSFLPFPTKLLAEAINQTDAERAAVIFYGLILFVISAIIASMWRYAATHRELLEPDVTDRDIAALNQRTTPNLAFYAWSSRSRLSRPRSPRLAISSSPSLPSCALAARSMGPPEKCAPDAEPERVRGGGALARRQRLAGPAGHDELAEIGAIEALDRRRPDRSLGAGTGLLRAGRRGRS